MCQGREKSGKALLGIEMSIVQAIQLVKQQMPKTRATRSILPVLVAVLITLTSCRLPGGVEPNSPSRVDSLDSADLPDQLEAATQRYTHPMTGFGIQYPVDWNITVKEFDENVSRGFVSQYFNQVPCQENCMGVRLSREDVALEMVMVQAYDDNVGDRCSNTVRFEEVGSGWYRLHTKDDVYYSQNVAIGRSAAEVSQDIAPNSLNEAFGSIEDEWSYREGIDYAICDQNTGTTVGGLMYSDEHDLPAMVVLEKPRVVGIPEVDAWPIIDAMVQSIEGIEGWQIYEFEGFDYLTTSGFRLHYPLSWEFREWRNDQAGSVEATVSKDGLMIQLTQGSIGAGDCVFPGEKDPVDMAARYGEYVALISAYGAQWRLASPLEVNGQDPDTFFVCEYNVDLGRFNPLTQVGLISVTGYQGNPDDRAMIETILTRIERLSL